MCSTGDFSYVLINFKEGFDLDTARAISEAFNAELATGKHDALFALSGNYI